MRISRIIEIYIQFSLVFANPSEAFDHKNQFHMRCFAPLVGITEDPFTGSVLGGLAAYVDTFGFLPKGTTTFQRTVFRKGFCAGCTLFLDRKNFLYLSNYHK